VSPRVEEILIEAETFDVWSPGAALCHDLGKIFSIPNHGPIAAEMLKPYVREDIYHAIYWHQEFQGRYYFEHLGKDPEGRERFRNESWFGFAEKLFDKTRIGMRVIISPNDAAPVEFSHPALFVPKAEAIAAASARAEPLAREAASTILSPP
jgi:hypothetical protein